MLISNWCNGFCIRNCQLLSFVGYYLKEIKILIRIMLSLNSYSSSNLNIIDDMTFKEKTPDKYAPNIYQRSKSLFYLDSNEFERSISPDEIDNPHKEKGSSGKNLFETMKHEINRLDTYTGKWPLPYVKPAHLAENGFFYLQSEDKVQCAFCHVVVDDWNVGQKPLKEHIKKSPRCPFLLSSNVGNVPIIQSQPVSRVSTLGGSTQINSSTYKPKYPRMADLKKRLMTYKDWPLIMLSSKQLAECGLYYTGVADVVTCFFCGGSLGNWELNDDPWAEHTKFFPNCAYLSLVRRHGGMQRQLSAPTPQASPTPQPTIQQHQSGPNLSTSLANEIISEASNIFPKLLVQKVVMQHLKESSRHFASLSELCEAILEYTEKESLPSLSYDVTGHTDKEQNQCEVNTDVVCSDLGNITGASSVTYKEESQVNNVKEVKDIFLCKICMDRERSVAFHPCRHLIACRKCAELIFICPMCRAPVTSKVEMYLS